MINYIIIINSFLKLLLITIVIFSYSCAFNFYTPLTDDLSNESLIGEWKLTEDSIVFLKKENLWKQNEEVRLTLKGNTTFELINIPDCWRNTIRNCSGTGLSYRGKWSINKYENSDKWLHLVENDAGYNKTYAVPIIKRKGKILIAFVLGDPDAGREIYFEKN